MEQKKTTNSQKNKFSKVLVGDYYINTIDSLLESKESKNIEELESFVKCVCSQEKKEQLDGSFDEYFAKLISVLLNANLVRLLLFISIKLPLFKTK